MLTYAEASSEQGNYKTMNKTIIRGGALIEKPKFEDYRYEFVMGAALLPEEFSVRDKISKVEAQGDSYSCIGQAFAYYAEVLNKIETNEDTQLSARDIYSLIHQPNGGAFLRDGALKLVKSGVVLEKDAPSYIGEAPPTEAFMRQRNDITTAEIERGHTYLSKSAFRVPERSVRAIKQAIFEGHGCVGGVIGDNAGWEEPEGGIVKPPKNGNWGHSIFLTGFKVINGKEYIEFCNSWGSGWGNLGYGYLGEDYFKSGNVFRPWVLIDIPNKFYPTAKKQISLLQKLIVFYEVLIERLRRTVKKALEL